MMQDFNTLGILLVALFILIKDVLVPLVKHLNHGGTNPVKLEVFYQEFKDFKDEQCKWCDKTEKRIEKLEEKA